jgi:hypothetical protein
MHKKLIMVCMAIAAFAAFVVAPAASASPVLTDVGKAFATGASIEGKNTGIIKFTGGFDVECATGILRGTVTSNTGTKIKGTIPVGGVDLTGTASGFDCTSFFGATKVSVTSEICFETVTGNDTIVFTGCASNVVFDLEVTGLGNCKYETTSITGTYVTNSGATSNISEQPFKFKEGVWPCPTEGKLDFDFDLYTTGSATQLTIS